MQLPDLITPISSQTDEELLERIREIRHRRTVVRPATVRRVAQKERRESRSNVSKAESLLSGLSEDDKQKLLQQLMEQGE